MRKSMKNKKLLAVLAVSCLSLSAIAGFAIGSTKAYAEDALARPTETDITATDAANFYMYDGASVRVDTSGIRFITYVKAEWHESLSANDATVTYFATAKAVGKKEQAQVITFSESVDTNGYYTLYTYINFAGAETTMADQIQALYAQDFTTSTFAKVVSANGETTYYQADEGEGIVRSMRAVGNEAYLNWTAEAKYEQADVEKYFTVGNRSTETTAYALDTGKVAFQMPEYACTTESVTAYVGAKKYTATYEEDSNSYVIENCTEKAANLSVFADDGKVYSTKMGEGTEICDSTTMADLLKATEGNYVLTADINMEEQEWKPTAQFAGTIDGLGHKITNFTAQQGHYGLIQYSGEGAVIKNIDIHMLTNGWKGGLIGQVKGATTIENVNVICDKLNGSSYNGVIANVIQGTLTVKDTNIIIKTAEGNNTNSGFIAGGEANSYSIVVSNVVCYNPTGLATTPYDPVNTTHNIRGTLGTYGTDGNAALPNEDYFFYNSIDALLAASKAGKINNEFASLLEEANVLTLITEDNVSKLLTATSGYYALAADVDMSGTKTTAWEPTNQFAGTLDGNGYAIKNFTAQQGHYGLIQYSGEGAVIKNIDIHMTTNGWKGGLIGQVKGATTIENVNVICDKLNGGTYNGVIANVIQGTLTVKDTNIIIKAAAGNNTNSGFIAGGEANSYSIVVSNVVCYNPTGLATTPYDPVNTTHNTRGTLGTYGTDGNEAEENVDWWCYQSTTALAEATLSAEFIALLAEAGIEY